jgi:CheY-like chemotaxis protein
MPECEQDPLAALPRLLQERFDVVIMDLVMPVLSGFDLLRMVQSKTRLAPVIAVSSHNEFRYKATQHGFDAFIAKPVEISKLRPLLEGLMPSA